MFSLTQLSRSKMSQFKYTAHQAEASLYLFSRQIKVGLFMAHLGAWGPSGKKVGPSCICFLPVPSWPPFWLL